MDYWEFLIQQEGDQTWLPLETKQVEILEGRYRVAAHTSRANTPVEIRVSHLLLDEIPPRRRVRKRRDNTNETGLIIIFPYMSLKPGRWEVRCSGDDLMDDLLGAGWQEAVQLQVLAREDDWAPDWSANPNQDTEAVPPQAVPDNSTPLIHSSQSEELDSSPSDKVPTNIPLKAPPAEPVTANQPISLVESIQADMPTTETSHPTDLFAKTEADTISQQIVDEIFEDVDQVLTPPGSTIAAGQDQLTAVASDSDYRLQLEKQAYVSPPGTALALTGQILREFGSSLAESHLVIQLRDPQTAQVLFETRQYLAQQPLPAAFEINIPLPPQLKTRVILGAVSLQDKLNPDTGTILASAAFTVTLGLDQLLDAIATQINNPFEEEISIYPGTTEPFVEPEENLSTLISPDIPFSLQSPPVSAPSEGMTLPPQIYHPTEEKEPSTPQLPSLPKKVPTEVISAEEERINEETDSLTETQVNNIDVSENPSTPTETVGDDVVEQEANRVSTPSPQEEETTADIANTSSPNTVASPQPKISLPSPTARVPAQFEDDSIEDDDFDAELAASILEDDEDELDALDADNFNRLNFSPSNYPPNDSGVGTGVNSDDVPRETSELDADPSTVQVESAFQSLNLQGRFWDRLTALTYDGYQAAAELKDAMQAAGVTPPTPKNPRDSAVPEDLKATAPIANPTDASVSPPQLKSRR